MNAASRLDELRADFLANTTLSMPIAGMIFWGVVALASLRLPPQTVALLVLFGSGMVFPLGVLIDRLRAAKQKRSPQGGEEIIRNHSGVEAACPVAGSPIHLAFNVYSCNAVEDMCVAQKLVVSKRRSSCPNATGNVGLTTTGMHRQQSTF